MQNVDDGWLFLLPLCTELISLVRDGKLVFGRHNHGHKLGHKLVARTSMLPTSSG